MNRALYHIRYTDQMKNLENHFSGCSYIRSESGQVGNEVNLQNLGSKDGAFGSSSLGFSMPGAMSAFLKAYES